VVEFLQFRKVKYHSLISRSSESPEKGFPPGKMKIKALYEEKE